MKVNKEEYSTFCCQHVDAERRAHTQTHPHRKICVHQFPFLTVETLVDYIAPPLSVSFSLVNCEHSEAAGVWL